MSLELSTNDLAGLIHADKRVLSAGVQCRSPENDTPRQATPQGTSEAPFKDKINDVIVRHVAHQLENIAIRAASAPIDYASGYVEANKVSQQITKNSKPLYKRIIICCDGTWNNGLASPEATNVLKLARCIFPQDRSTFPPTPQVVFYQTGLGTTNALPLDVAQGATGAGILAKIREAYAFISQNYIPGDEIFLFGFSRGAFTVRTIASLIADIGILNTKGMEDFHQVLAAYQVRRRCSEHEADAEQFLNYYRSVGKKRVSIMKECTLKCVGVWDTVGALGMPGFFGRNYNLLGFKDTKLSRHVKYAFHAIALHETRKDFMPTKWVQKSPSKTGRKHPQVLKQVWFSGSHSDVGGGYPHHDLSDLTLIWMVANMMKYNLLAIDEDYLSTLPAPQAGWGKMSPTDPIRGVWSLGLQTVRHFPTSWNEASRETFHPSVACQEHLQPEIAKVFHEHRSDLVEELLPFEEKMRQNWASITVRKARKLVEEPLAYQNHREKNIFGDILQRIHGLLDVGLYGLEIVRGHPSTNEEAAHDLLTCPGEVASVAGVDQLDVPKSDFSEDESLGFPSPQVFTTQLPSTQP